MYLFIIFIIGIIIRISFLFLPMRCDESYTFVFFASQPLKYAISNYILPNNHFLYTILEHLVCSNFGDYPWIIRLPALIAGLLVIPVNYLVISDIYNKEAALLSSGLIASSSILVEYSVNGRGYTLIILFFLLILYFANYIIIHNKLIGWLPFIFFSALGFYTIPIMLYPLTVVSIWFVLSVFRIYKKENRNKLIIELLSSLAIIFLLTCILYLPVFITSGIKSVIANRFVTFLPFQVFIKLIPQLLHSVWITWIRDIPSFMFIIFNLSMLFTVISDTIIAKKNNLILLSVFIGSFSILFMHRSIPTARIFLFLLPLYFGIVSVSLTSIFIIFANGRKTLQDFFPVLVIILTFVLSCNTLRSTSIYYSEETGTLRSAQDIIFQLRKILNKDDRVVSLTPSDGVLAYYFYLYKIPFEYLSLDLKSAKRIFIIVKHYQKLNNVLERKGVTDFKDPHLISRFEDAVVYEMVREEQFKTRKEEIGG